MGDVLLPSILIWIIATVSSPVFLIAFLFSNHLFFIQQPSDPLKCKVEYVTQLLRSLQWVLISLEKRLSFPEGLAWFGPHLPSTAFSLFTLLGPHWLSCTANISGTPKPQDLFYGSSFFLVGSPSRFLQISYPHAFSSLLKWHLFNKHPWPLILKLWPSFYPFPQGTPSLLSLVVFLHSIYHHLTHYLFHLFVLFVFSLVLLECQRHKKKNLYLFCSLLYSPGPWIIYWTIGAQWILIEWMNAAYALRNSFVEYIIEKLLC